MKKTKIKSIAIPIKSLSKVDCQFCKGTGEVGSYYFEEKCKRCYGIGWFWTIDNKWIIEKGAKV